MKRLFSLLTLASLFAPILMMTGCATKTEHELHLAAVSDLPIEMQHAPQPTREAYQFAVTNPNALKNVPCFCGCAPLGHTNNYDCYIKGASNNEKIIFDAHALGCQICVDITQDVMKMTREGRAPPQIQRAIIKQYSQFGPSNFPETK